MKSLKSLVVAGFAVAAFVQSASAQTTIYITGSSAYRSATIAAIGALTGGIWDGSDEAPASGPAKKTSYIWKNRTYNDTTTGLPVTGVTVKATFTGSAAGRGPPAKTSLRSLLPGHP